MIDLPPSSPNRDHAAPRPALSHDLPGAAAVARLTRDDCRWPLGEIDDGAFRFCGERRHRGSYCAAHRTLSRQGAAR